MDQHTPWKVISSQRVIDTPYLRLRRDSIELPGGIRIDDYYVRESHGFVIVFALTPDDQVVLVEQYRHGIAEHILELPAGKIDPGEDPATCARRELSEETGYVGSPSEPEHVATFFSDPVNSNGRFHLFLVRGALQTSVQHLDVTEQITVRHASIPQLRGFLRDGTFSTGSQVSAAYFMLDRLGYL